MDLNLTQTIEPTLISSLKFFSRDWIVSDLNPANSDFQSQNNLQPEHLLTSLYQICAILLNPHFMDTLKLRILDLQPRIG